MSDKKKTKNKELALTRKVNAYIKEVEQYLKDNDQYESMDKAVMESLRDSYTMTLLAQEAIEEHGLIVRTYKGDLVANKAIKIKQDATIRFEKCLEILGIQNRQRYKNKEVVTEEEPTALDIFIKGGK